MDTIHLEDNLHRIIENTRDIELGLRIQLQKNPPIDINHIEQIRLVDRISELGDIIRDLSARMANEMRIYRERTKNE